MSLENEIIGVDHLGILTGDLKRDVAWYEEKLGFEKIQQRIVVMNGRTEIDLLKKENLVSILSFSTLDVILIILMKQYKNIILILVPLKRWD